MKTAISILTALLLTAGAALAADSHKGHAGHSQGDGKSAAPAAAALADGEVRRIDKAQGKITLRHGEIRNLDMPPMTMVFKVKDPAMLDAVKPGDRIGFTAEKIGGDYVVTGIEARKP